MSKQPEALRLAAELEATHYYEELHEEAAFELRRLYLVEQSLDRCRVVCDATSEGWRADAERWQAQRDALLEALRKHVYLHDKDCVCEDCAAIKSVEDKQ